MFSLQTLLRRYSRTVKTIQGGSDEIAAEAVPAPQAPAAFDKRRFIADLAGLRRTNTIAIATLVFVLAAAFIIILLLVRQHDGNASTAASLFVSFGALSTGMTTAILGAFRVKAQSDLLAILSKNMDAASLQTAIDALAKRT